MEWTLFMNHVLFTSTLPCCAGSLNYFCSTQYVSSIFCNIDGQVDLAQLPNMMRQNACISVVRISRFVGTCDTSKCTTVFVGARYKHVRIQARYGSTYIPLGPVRHCPRLEQVLSAQQVATLGWTHGPSAPCAEVKTSPSTHPHIN